MRTTFGRASFLLAAGLLLVLVTLCCCGFHNNNITPRIRLVVLFGVGKESVSSEESSSNDNNKVRLNKVFKATHSRRESDDLIACGRVTINGLPIDSKGGSFVIPFKDVIKLDGQVIKGWEGMNNNNAHQQSNTSTTTSLLGMDQFEYVKYYKPFGVTCTTDLNIKRNIIHEITIRNGFSPQHRVFPVGRLDKDTSGLILLTSDGRLPNAALRSSQKQPKTYHIRLDKDILDSDIQKLRDGIIITTVAQKDNNKAFSLTAKTMPCIVERFNSSNKSSIIMTIMEGRNRQIRKMLEILNFEVIGLKRVKFAGINLDDLKAPGDWKRLNKKEMKIVERIVEKANNPQ